MRGHSSNFYADEDDLSNLLEAFQEFGGYKYVQIGSELNKLNLVFSDPAKVLSLSVVTPSSPSRRQSFLVMENDEEIFSREIVLTDGSGVRNVADQSQNWNSIALAFGGDAGDQTLIMSDINTSGDTKKAIQIHEKFKNVVTSRVKKVGRREDHSD